MSGEWKESESHQRLANLLQDLEEEDMNMPDQKRQVREKRILMQKLK